MTEEYQSGRRNVLMERSKQLYVAKVFAILSVICAHMTLTIEKGQAGWLADKIIAIYGTIGVALFFLCAGYYYHREKGDSIVFWKKKLKSIVLPWVVCSVLTYLFNIVLSREAYSIMGQLKWSMGYLTWYYFVPVLLFCFVWFKCSIKRRWLYIAMAISIVSNILTITRIWWVTEWCTPYTNPFNWLLFFALGILWRQKEEYIERIVTQRAVIVIVGIGFIVLFGLWAWYNMEISYWNSYSLLFEVLGCMCIIYLAWCFRNVVFLQRIGKNTFFIYLIHMQIAGIINTRLPQNAFFYLVKPIIVLVFIWLLIEIAIKLACILKINKLLGLVGIREK